MKRTYNILIRDDCRGVLKRVADLLNRHPETAEHVLGIASTLEIDSMRKRLRAETGLR